MGGTFGVDMPNVGGLPADWNRVIIDGVVGNEIGNSGMNAQMVNLDAIAEVRLLNNSYRAEYGQSGGSQLQIVTRGGTSEYRGSTYWYMRNEKLNSVEFFRARSQKLNGIEPFPPKYRFNTWGANLGGPVKKNQNKMFFFYSMEAPLVKRPQSVQTWRMPSALEREGNFSQTFDNNGALIFVKDPASSLPCSATAGGAGCFPGNIIPANRLDSNGLALLNQLPLPNALGQSPNYNFTRQETADNPRFNNLVRVDMRPSSGSTIWATVRTFSSSQYGSEITAGPAKSPTNGTTRFFRCISRTYI